MSSGFTAVSSPIDVATSGKQRINNVHNGSNSFSRDNSGDTVSGDSDNKRSSDHSQQDRPGSSGENAFEGDDDVIDLNAENSDKRSFHGRQWRNKPDSCSSYSSLNNDECSSLHSHDEEGSTTFDLPRQFAAMVAGSGGGCRGPTNYPRKYSLTVPGEPRHMRTLHRRESGSRSPLNSSCGGLSPSELSTPSPSISNSM